METEQIKSGIKITELAAQLGIELRNGKTRCLWHDEKTPSLSFDDTKGIYKCFGCGEKGDIFTLYQKVKNCDFKTAKEALGGSDQSDVPIAHKKAVTGRTSGNSVAPRGKVDDGIIKNQPDPELYELFVEHLYAEGRGETVDSFLKDRGFTEETLSRFMVAGIRDVEKTKKYLLDTFGKDRLFRAGLISKVGFVFNRHPVIIPVVCDGRIVAVRGRNLTGENPKYLQAVGIQLPIFNADEQSETIYLTEGEFDAMALVQSGMVAYGICGTNGFKDEFKKHFENKDVILAFDNDVAGEKARKEVSEKLKDVANSISFIVPAIVKDMNEMMQKGIDINSLPKTIIKDGIRIVHIADIAEEQRKDMSMERKPTGFGVLDEAFNGGLRAGNAMIVAALAGEGKTAWMQTLSYHYAKQGVLSLWFSYEETMAEIWERFEGMGVDRSYQLFAPFDLQDSKIDFIEKAIERQKKKTPFFVVFVDQLFNLYPKVDAKSKIEHLSANHSLYLGLMSTQLKDIAMRHKIIVVTAHQLNKSGELSYSDMVRHAPDKVIYLKREEAPSGSADQFTDKTIMKVNKNRPFGTRPIVPLTVRDGLFERYSMIDDEYSRKLRDSREDKNNPFL